MLDELELFSKVVENGSISKTAASLKANIPTISRRIQNLEQTLGYKLFLHKGNSLELTEQGQKLYQLVCPHLNSLSSAIESAKENTTKPDGTIKLIISPIFSYLLINDKLSQLLEQHPQLNLVIYPGFTTPDGARNDFDLALSYFVPENSYLIQKTLLKLNAGIYTTQVYLDKHGMPQSWSELEQRHFITQNQKGHYHHSVMLKSVTSSYLFQLKNSQIVMENFIQSLMVLNLNNYLLFLPNIMVPDIQEQHNLKLVRIFPDYTTELSMDVFLVKRAAFDNNKTRLITDFINSSIEKYKQV